MNHWLVWHSLYVSVCVWILWQVCAWVWFPSAGPYSWHAVVSTQYWLQFYISVSVLCLPSHTHRLGLESLPACWLVCLPVHQTLIKSPPDFITSHKTQWTRKEYNLQSNHIIWAQGKKPLMPHYKVLIHKWEMSITEINDVYWRSIIHLLTLSNNPKPPTPKPHIHIHTHTHIHFWEA